MSEKRRKTLEAYTLARMILSDLRGFLDHEDYRYLQRAYRLGEYAWNNGFLDEMPGLRDLYSNLKSMYELGASKRWELSDEEFAELSHQASYTLLRASVIASGLNYRLKRMRGV